MKSFLSFFVPAILIQIVVFHVEPETTNGEWCFLLVCFVGFNELGYLQGALSSRDEG